MMSMVATLAFKQPPVDELIATWLQTAALNFPMPLLWQLLYCGPLARLIFRLLFARQLKKDTEQAKAVPAEK